MTGRFPEFTGVSLCHLDPTRLHSACDTGGSLVQGGRPGEDCRKPTQALCTETPAQQRESTLSVRRRAGRRYRAWAPLSIHHRAGRWHRAWLSSSPALGGMPCSQRELM